MTLKVTDQPTFDLIGKGQAIDADGFAPEVLVAQAADEARHPFGVRAEHSQGVVPGHRREPQGLLGIHRRALLDRTSCLNRQRTARCDGPHDPPMI
jgi:hypothetical protein